MVDQNEILAQTLWNYHRLNHEIVPADCIIGLGSYDLRVAEKCAELFLNGFGSYIVFSGSEGNWTRGRWDKSEAAIFADIAYSKGVPKDKVFLEDKSTNLGENIRFTRQLLQQQNKTVQQIIVVTKPNTERRAYATVKKEWPEVKVYIASPDLTFQSQPTEDRSKEELINEMVGDLQRIKVYYDQGYQIYQEIPMDVWAAYQVLVNSGFDKHLIK